MIYIVNLIFILLIMFQLKHYLSDYPLQTEWMVKGKFSQWPTFFVPLAAHAGVHATFSFLISLVTLAVVEHQFTISNLMLSSFLAITDFVIHFAMDRIKASPNLCGKFKVTESRFWYVLGLDQMVHHLTHYWLIYIIVINVVIFKLHG